MQQEVRELKVKVSNKNKEWKKMIQPFLDRVVAAGYRWKDYKRKVRLNINGHYIYVYMGGLGTYRAWTDAHGALKFYETYFNIGLTSNGKKMIRMPLMLYIPGNTSESEDNALEIAIKIWKNTPSPFEPDFEYEF
ncbi:MAG: hypothetical protein FWC11_01235 [Firmicutes bacterium]|nr:hypothetical protein [Bacillota bacterium]